MLTVRQLNPSAHVVVAVRGRRHALLRQSGANAVVTSSEAVGRLLGLSAVSPHLGAIIETCSPATKVFEVSERPVTKDEIGRSPSEVNGERVIAWSVIRLAPVLRPHGCNTRGRRPGRCGPAGGREVEQQITAQLDGIEAET